MLDINEEWEGLGILKTIPIPIPEIIHCKTHSNFRTIPENSFICISVVKCIVALRIGVGVESCTVVFLFFGHC